MSNRTAGYGKSLPELHEALFGKSPSAKAFRALLKSPEEVSPELTNLAGVAIRDLAESQEFKTAWKADGYPDIRWESVRDPATFMQKNDWILSDLKKWMDARLGIPTKRLSKWTSEFLRDWVNTDVTSMPRPDRATETELLPFRPETTRVYYRGIRFQDIGEMIAFHQKYATGKAFPFQSDRFTSWSIKPRIAEKFGRYRGSASQNHAMMGWFSRAKANKDYDGHGGYLIGARIAPKQTLVEIGHEDLPPFGKMLHGNEGEVIVRPNVLLVAKVYGVYGNPEQDVKDFLASNLNRPPTDPYFFGYLSNMRPKVLGDADSGTVTFTLDPKSNHPPEATPRSFLKPSELGRIFGGRMYQYEWVSDDTVRYTRMLQPWQRVAACFLYR